MPSFGTQSLPCFWPTSRHTLFLVGRVGAAVDETPGRRKNASFDKEKTPTAKTHTVEMGIPTQEEKSTLSNNLFVDRDSEGIYIACNQDESLNIEKIIPTWESKRIQCTYS